MAKFGAYTEETAASLDDEVLMCRIGRIGAGDTFSGDVERQRDFHYQRIGLGSSAEFPT